MEDLQLNYKPKNEKERKKINRVLIQANELLKYRNKIIDAFKNGIFLSEY